MRKERALGLRVDAIDAAIFAALVLASSLAAAQPRIATSSEVQFYRTSILRENQKNAHALRLDFRPHRVEPPGDYENATRHSLPGNRPQIDACQAAARAYIDYMARPAAPLDSRTAAGLSVTADLRNRCMAAVSDSAIQTALGPLGGQIGSLTFQDEPHCTAFRTRSDRILTARHCLWMRTGKVHPLLSQRGGRLADLRFVPALGARQYPVTPADCTESDPASCAPLAPYQPFGFAEDVVELRLVGAEPATPGASTFASNVVPGDTLILVGASSLLSGANKAPYQPELLAMAAGVGCVVGEVKDACLYHGCLALASFSGAAVVRIGRHANQPQIVGMHLEGVGPSPAECSGAAIRRSGNVALRYGYGGFRTP